MSNDPSSTGKPPEKICNDSVHGFISLPPICYRIIDTPQFQRLRNIKQLGGAYYVYPGASHNRFEHSIGVCHLAGKLVKKLKVNQPELGITPEDVLCVQIAGLCHDLGHGPLSHVFDEHVIAKLPQEDFLQESDSKWTHEKASCDMFEHMLKEESGNKALIKEFEDTFPGTHDVKGRITEFIKPVSRMTFTYTLGDGSGERMLPEECKLTFLYISKVEDRIHLVEDRIKELSKLPKVSSVTFEYKLEDESGKRLSGKFELTDPNIHEVEDGIRIVQDRIKELIKPLEEYANPNKEKKFLYEIVANEITKIDVDKWDYFIRDCHHLGLKNAFDHPRLIKSARVINDQLCFRDKEVRNVYEMFHTREALHRQAYKHKTTLIIEDKIGEALRLAWKSSAFKIAGKTLKESIQDPVAFTSLDDTVMWLILNPRSKAEKECVMLMRARVILQQIQRREHPRFICPVKVEVEDDLSHNKLDGLKDKIKPKVPGLVIAPAEFDYGNKANNPLHAARFYSKHDPDKIILGEELADQVSLMIPSKFKETVLFFYSDIDTREKIKATATMLKTSSLIS